MNAEELVSAVARFQGRIPGLDLGEEFVKSIKSLRDEKSWDQAWSAHPGIYCFLQNDELVYVGRATPTTNLGRRVNDQISSFGNDKWDRVIEDGSTSVYMWVFPRADWHWLAALEVVLIDQTPRPEFNKRL